VFGNIIGPIISNSSKFAFAILGVHLIFQAHDSVHSPNTLHEEDGSES
jgi:hypothetical protein